MLLLKCRRHSIPDGTSEGVTAGGGVDSSSAEVSMEDSTGASSVCEEPVDSTDDSTETCFPSSLLAGAADSSVGGEGCVSSGKESPKEAARGRRPPSSSPIVVGNKRRRGENRCLTGTYLSWALLGADGWIFLTVPPLS